ncbi:tpt-domain-containing protein [Phaffia rhodozyma]|uniref:Tpt-domain-containing protein n=1 Tax=Phaffia rhodozyma TaxID=264483 RepID=A0A0F7SKW1_PHARH|nr:tpt-domain-containing protein [Phaffia rhodozyma]
MVEAYWSSTFYICFLANSTINILSLNNHPRLGQPPSAHRIRLCIGQSDNNTVASSTWIILFSTSPVSYIAPIIIKSIPILQPSRFTSSYVPPQSPPRSGESSTTSSESPGVDSEDPRMHRAGNSLPAARNSIYSGLALNPGLIRKLFNSAPFWLAVYFCFNLSLTLFNKIVLVRFPFPYTLTGIHALSCCVGCYIAIERRAFVPAKTTPSDNLILIGFSILYTINISVSNLSLQLVTVPFHQVVRAATPLFTIIISTLLLKTTFSKYKIFSLLPVIIGVGLATYGDYQFTIWGLTLTLLGTLLAAVKTVVTNLIQTGVGGRTKLHPLDLLMRMSPLAFVQCVIYGWLSGELGIVWTFGTTEMTKSQALALTVNGMVAFGLNIVSFTANKKTSALTMTVAANVKQVLTIVLSIVIFDLSINPINGLGIFLTLCGGGAYAYIEHQEKAKVKRKLRFR